jgi:hypothetical protein
MVPSLELAATPLPPPFSRQIHDLYGLSLGFSSLCVQMRFTRMGVDSTNQQQISPRARHKLEIIKNACFALSKRH